MLSAGVSSLPIASPSENECRGVLRHSERKVSEDSMCNPAKSMASLTGSIGTLKADTTACGGMLVVPDAVRLWRLTDAWSAGTAYCQRR